jgi:hypothetical protein
MGFFLGLFGALDLVLFGTIRLDSFWITWLPPIGFVVGIVWAWSAPLGRRRPAPAHAARSVPAAPPPPPAAPPPPPVDNTVPPAEAAPPDTP